MTRLTILEYPDTRLRRRAKPVKAVNVAVQTLMDDMLETMYAANGVGLAAPQVDAEHRVIVIDVSDSRNAPLMLANPEIIDSDGRVITEEGCLSVPAIYEKVARAERVRVRGLDRAGNSVEHAADGLLAVCIQHEIDHLDGKVFVDYLSELKRQLITRRLRKSQGNTREGRAAVAV